MPGRVNLNGLGKFVGEVFSPYLVDFCRRAGTGTAFGDEFSGIFPR
jgi:hypothetical protein